MKWTAEQFRRTRILDGMGRGTITDPAKRAEAKAASERFFAEREPERDVDGNENEKE